MTVAGGRTDRGADPPDADLLSAVGDGDVAALRTVYERHAALAYGLALRLTGGHAERAEAVVESAFLQLWRGPDARAGTGSVQGRVIALVVGAAEAGGGAWLDAGDPTDHAVRSHASRGVGSGLGAAPARG